MEIIIGIKPQSGQNPDAERFIWKKIKKNAGLTIYYQQKI